MGTIRALSTSDRDMIFERVYEIAENTAKAMVVWLRLIASGYPVTYNNPELTQLMLPSLGNAVGNNQLDLVPARTGAEDFAFYAQEVPGLFFSLGGMPSGTSVKDAPPHHAEFMWMTLAWFMGSKPL